MSAIFNTVKVVDLNRYVAEFNDDGTEKHLSVDGARYHVISYGLVNGKAVQRCSCANCEINGASK